MFIIKIRIRKYYLLEPCDYVYDISIQNVQLS